MSNQNVFASILIACLLAIGLGGLSQVANAGPSAQTFLNSGKSSGNTATQVEYRYSEPRIHPRIGPSYSGYDYPYYYNRGYYPTHIGPGYVYNYPLYSYKPARYKKYSRQCSHWHRKCSANWGSKSDDYYGCMEFHRCD
jgi:hypothetical protein